MGTSISNAVKLEMPHPLEFGENNSKSSKKLKVSRDENALDVRGSSLSFYSFWFLFLKRRIKQNQTSYHISFNVKFCESAGKSGGWTRFSNCVQIEVGSAEKVIIEILVGLQMVFKKHYKSDSKHEIVKVWVFYFQMKKPH